ncbi:MAG: hypothetical protein Q8M47_01335 [Devosia sp.]|nr:hypothetical protein [Devosia sp.]
MSDYLLVERTPTVREFCDLRVSVGLSAKTTEAAAAGLPIPFTPWCSSTRAWRSAWAG